MKKSGAIILTILLSLIVTAVIFLNSSGFQRKVIDAVANNFKQRTGSTLTIHKASFNIFRGYSFHVLRIEDAKSRPILTAERLDIGIDLFSLLNNQISFDYFRLIRGKLSLSRKDSNSPLNIEPILKGYSSKNKTKNVWDISLNSLILRECELKYSVDSEPSKQGLLDPNHLRISNISTILSFKNHENNLYRLTIKKLKAHEQKGLSIDQLSFDGYFSKQSIRIRQLSLVSGKSKLFIPTIEGNFEDIDDLAKRLQSVQLKPFIIDLTTVPAQFGYIVQSLKSFQKQVDLHATVSGNLDRLNCRNLSLKMQDQGFFDGNFLVKNLTDAQRIELNGTINNLAISEQGLILIQKIVDEKGTNTLNYIGLKTLNYSGIVNATSKQGSLKGSIFSGIGNLKTDLIWSKLNSVTSIHGRVSSDSLFLNKFLPKSIPLGETQFDLNLDGKYIPTAGLSGNLIGNISHVVYKGYDFKNLTLSGKFDKKSFEGKANLDDLNGKLDFTGLVEFKEKASHYSFDLIAEGFNPFAFGLMGFQNHDNFYFSLHSDLVGTNLENLKGSLSIDSLSIETSLNHFTLSTFELTLDKILENRTISITSPLLNASINGVFRLSTLKDDVLSMLNGFMPAVLNHNYKTQSISNFVIDASLEPCPELFSILGLKYNLNKKAELHGFLNEGTGKFRLKVDLPSLIYGKTNIVDAGVLLENPQNEAKLRAYGLVGNSDDPLKINVDIRGLNDMASFKLNMANQGLHTYSSSISGDLKFKRGESGKLEMNGLLNESNIIINDSVWNIKPTNFNWHTDALQVNNFELTHGNQFVKLQGIASSNIVDTMHISLNNFSLDNIFDLIPKGSVHLGGKISGDASIAQLFGKISMEADLNVSNFTLNKVALGNLKATSKWDPIKKALVLDASVLTDSTDNIPSRLLATGKGYYFPSKDSMDLSLDGNRLPIRFLEPYLGTILNNIQGNASGNILIQGPMKHLALNTKVYVEDGAFGIEMLNTRYSFSDTIWVSPTRVFFKNTIVKDKDGNEAIANGLIRHSNFKNSKTAIEIIGKNILCMDLPANSEAYFYGKAYGSGTVSINGTESEMVIDVDLKTEKNSDVTISFLDDKEIVNAGFIQFVNHDPIKEVDEDFYFGRKKKLAVVKANKTNLIVNLNIEATPEAQLTLITDPASGDDITATGSGTLRCVFADNQDLSIYGRYNIEKGKYKFIYQNLLRRDFKISDGGNITFAGNPFAAQLNINAAYTVNAQLSDLLATDILSNLNLNRTSIPVNCLLKLNGELQRPDIKLDLAYPSADEDLVRSINDVINTEDARNQQLVFLMVFGRFSTPSYSSAQGTTSNSMSTFLNTGISTLSSQLNRIVNGVLGEQNINFNFNYKNSSYDATTPGEWGVNMSGKFFNNRLSVTSNLGSRENLAQNGGGNQFIGEFDANLKFKNSEKWNWKFFNRANDNRYFKSALNTQGVGILYKEDFNSFFDIFKKKKKKEIPLAPSLPDTRE